MPVVFRPVFKFSIFFAILSYRTDIERNNYIEGSESARIKELVNGHFVPRSFRTPDTSNHFGNFVPPFWSFRTL